MILRGALIWGALALVVAIPLIAAAQSPLLQWRDPIYVVAGFSGIVALALLLIQALLIGGVLPCVQARRLHFWTGVGLIVAVSAHVIGLWITSPPDVIDVLLFRSPTPFSIWGVLAMWAVLIGGLIAGLRKRIGRQIWRLGHVAAAIMMIIGTVVHAWLIQGTMDGMTKASLCFLVVAAGALAVLRTRVSRLSR